jgi:lipopolysaccharide heptosyltransferase II
MVDCTSPPDALALAKDSIVRIGAIKLVDEYAGRALAAVAAPFLGAATERRDPRAILFVKFWGLGSIVLASPAARAARAAFPGARIDILTLAGNEPVCEALGLFDRVHIVRIDSVGRFATDALRTLAAIRRARYDAVVDLELFAYVSALVAAASGAPRRIGFSKAGRAVFTETADFDPRRHVVESFRSLAERLVGAPLRAFHLSIPRAPEADRSVAAILDGSGVRARDLLVAMNINASPLAFERRWEREKFAALVARLSARFGAHVVLTGSKAERPYVEGLLAELPSPASVTNLAGRLAFTELVALLRRSDVLITNDSGPLHVASALDTPTIALFGPETPVRYGPLASQRLVFYLGLACSPCMSVENRKTVNCNYNQLCMRSLSVEEVWEGIERFVRGLEAGGRGLGSQKGVDR